MIRTLVLPICLLAATHTVVAQSKSAPPTAEEQKMLVEARAMMKASGMPIMTAEQELEFLERSRQVRMGILANMQGLRQGIPGLQLPQAPQQAPESRVASAPPATAETGFAATDGDLASQVRSRLVGGPPTLFEPRRDGFTLNGQANQCIFNVGVHHAGAAQQFAGRAVLDAEVAGGDHFGLALGDQEVEEF